MQVFRRLLLQRLHKAERLSESFMHNLLSWVHPGFSVFAGPAVEAAALASIVFQARYITRPALAMDALHKLQDGNLALETPPDPRTGAMAVTLDPLEWIDRITAHIPDPGRHGQRFYGAYSNRARVTRSSAVGESAGSAAEAGAEKDNSDISREARSTWARLLGKIFEVDPLVCKCGARMRIISFITDPRVIDRILRHRESSRCRAKDPFETRAPPSARKLTSARPFAACPEFSTDFLPLLPDFPLLSRIEILISDTEGKPVTSDPFALCVFRPLDTLRLP